MKIKPCNTCKETPDPVWILSVLNTPWGKIKLGYKHHLHCKCGKWIASHILDDAIKKWNDTNKWWKKFKRSNNNE